MKRLSLIAAFCSLAVLASCAEKQTKYSVNIVNGEDATLSVVDELSGEAMPLNGQADKNALLVLKNDAKDISFHFFNDGKPITVDLEDKSFKGSEINEKLTGYYNDLNAIQDSLRDLMFSLRGLSPEEQKEKADEIRAKSDEISDQFIDKIKSILDENKDNLIPAAFASAASQVLEDEELDAFFAADAPYAKHPSTLAAKAKVDEQKARWEEIEAAKQAAIGKKFTDLEEPDVDGKMHKLSEYLGQGKWVFVDFWASWCGPCRREMPNVVAAYEKYHPKGLEIVGLSFDNDKAAWVKAIKDLKMPWIHLSDLKGWQTVASDAYNIKSIPSSLLVDPEGIIVARDLRGEALGAKLAEIFGE